MKHQYLKFFIVLGILYLSFPMWGKPVLLDSCQIYVQRSQDYSHAQQFTPALRAAKRALFFLEKKEQNLAKDSLAVVVYGRMGKVLIPSGEYFEALKWQQKAKALALKTYGENHTQTAKVYIELSECYWRLSQLQQGLDYAQRAYEIFITLEKTDEPIFAEVVGKLAGAYINLQDYSQAIIFYKKSLSLLKSKADFEETQAAPVYYNIGNAYLGKQQADTALPYFFKAMKLDKATGADFYVADDLDNIALAYQQKKEYERAILYYDQALDLYDKTVGLEHDYTAHAIKFKGECYLEMGEYEAAIELLTQASTLQEKLLGIHTKDVAICQMKLGKAYAASGHFCLSDEAFQTAYYALKFDIEKPDFENIVSSFTLLQVLNLQARLKFEQYHINCKFSLLKEAISSYEFAVNLMDNMRAEYSEKGSKLDLSSLFKQVLEGAIEAEYEAYLSDSEQHHLQAIFTKIEKTKGLLLLENLNQKKAQTLANLPQGVQEQLGDFQIQLAFLEQQQFEERQKTVAIDSSFLSRLDGKIFDVKQEQQVFEKKLKQLYPAYDRQLQKQHTIGLTETQEYILQENQTMIQYVIGEQSSYAMIIQKNKTQLVPLKDDFDYQYWTALYRDNLYGFYEEMSIKKADNLAKIALQRSNWAAWKLYQHLIQPLEVYDLTNELIIIPDHVLAELPFDALITAIPLPQTPFKHYHFLIKKYQISYCHSASVLYQMQQKENAVTRYNLIAFAPSFESNYINPFAMSSRKAFGQTTVSQPHQVTTYNRNNLNPLLYNVPEASAIQNMLGGELFIEEAATEAQFLATAEEARIIHLATHGKANDTIGDYSFLAFTSIPDDNENEFLYVKDLYHLQLQAEMVVLSACETGIGELQKGEGMLSLANGFAQAGAKSVITTLWTINDAQTQEIMLDFYKNLKRGQRKDEALRQAKLEQLLEGLNIYAHPFYWAAFTGFGDMRAI